MSLIPRFLQMMEELRPPVDAPLSLSTRVSVAVVATLPGAAGAVVCRLRSPVFRVVIGVSDQRALLDEQLEFTLGAGPGLLAAHAGRPVSAGSILAGRWPLLHDALWVRTGLAGMSAVPLGLDAAGDCSALLVVFYEDAAAADLAASAGRRDVEQLAPLVEHSVGLLAPVMSNQLGASSMSNLLRDDRRLNVEAVVGMLMASDHLSQLDALDVLRGFAFGHGRPIDDVADDIRSGRLDIHALR